MFFIPTAVFIRNSQSIYLIVEFRIYPFLYENKKELPEFKEKRFIMRWKPQMNT